MKMFRHSLLAGTGIRTYTDWYGTMHLYLIYFICDNIYLCFSYFLCIDWLIKFLQIFQCFRLFSIQLFTNLFIIAIFSHLFSFLFFFYSQNSRKKGLDKKNGSTINTKIIVDVREFRSSLPSLLHAAGEMKE